MKSTARFIVLDGGEGCGKSTQCRLLVERLRAEKISVLAVRDPGATDIGEAIRHVLLNPAHENMAMRCEMLLYMAARAQLMREKILPALEAGQWVVCDRFVSSTLAYQLGGDGLTREEILSAAQVATMGRFPDLTLILDLPTEIAQTRLQPKYVLPLEGAAEVAAKGVKDRIELRPTEYHRKVRDNFLAQAAAKPQEVKVVSAAGTTQEVSAAVWAAVGLLG